MPDSFDFKQDTSDPFWAFLKDLRPQAVDVEIGEHCGASVLSSMSGNWIQVSPERIRAALAQSAAAGRAFERSKTRGIAGRRIGWLQSFAVRFRTPLLVGGIMLGVLVSASAFEAATSGWGEPRSRGADLDPILFALGIGIVIAAAVIFRRTRQD